MPPNRFAKTVPICTPANLEKLLVYWSSFQWGRAPDDRINRTTALKSRCFLSGARNKRTPLFKRCISINFRRNFEKYQFYQWTQPSREYFFRGVEPIEPTWCTELETWHPVKPKCTGWAPSCRIIVQRSSRLTSPNPSRKRTKLNTTAPCLAASGVSRVRMAVDKIPRPRVCLPPNFCAKRPPGTCVTIYP